MDYENPRLRENIMKVHAILKKPPTSIVFYPKTFKKVEESYKNPQNLNDYGDPVNSKPKPSRKPKPEYMRSMETLPEGGMDKENDSFPYNLSPHRSFDRDHPAHYPPKNMLLSDLPFNNPNSKSSISHEPSQSSLRRLPSSFKTFGIDWAKTPLYSEYLTVGITKYNEKEHQAFFTESEAPQVFQLLQTRYSNTTSAKSTEPFFHKAMDTLGELLSSFNHIQLYRAIQQIYNKVDSQNTMKLVLRVKTMFDARYLLFQIFHDIREFKRINTNLDILLRSKEKDLIGKSYKMLSKCMDELQEINASLQDNLHMLSRDHKQLCKDEFIFEGINWTAYSQSEFNKLNNEVARRSINIEDNLSYKLL